MSSTNRTTTRGGKGTKGDTISKTQKTDKSDTKKPEKNKSGKFKLVLSIIINTFIVYTCYY